MKRDFSPLPGIFPHCSIKSNALPFFLYNSFSMHKPEILKYCFLSFLLIYLHTDMAAQLLTRPDITGKEITEISNTLNIVKIENGYKILRKDGRLVSNLSYEMVTAFSEQRAGVLRNGNWGFINENGQE